MLSQSIQLHEYITQLQIHYKQHNNTMPTYKEKKQKLKQLVKKEEEERIRKIQEEGYQFKNTQAFRVAQKHYKYYQHKETDYSKVLDVGKLPSFEVNGFIVHEIGQPKGAYLIKKFIDQETQYQVGFEAMNDYIRKPYRTNLDGTNGLYLEEKTENQNQPEKKVQNIKEIQSASIKLKEQAQTIKLKEEEKEEKQEKEEKKEDKKEDKKEQHSQEGSQIYNKEHQTPYYFNENIRMANLGYQYDWPHRSYPKTQVPIPQTIKSLTNKAKSLFELINKEQIEYHGEAVIVNFYKLKDYMIGHLDDGEEDQQNPIFSFNFGLSCIFLLGFPDKNQCPVAIRLQAGDLLIMSGYSRICYHGVPRIIENSFIPNQNQQIQQIANKIDEQAKVKHMGNGFKEINNYYSTHRLNVNVRQVWVRKNE